jgi:hypothetical protein
VEGSDLIEALCNLARAVAGMAAVMVIWFGIQAFIRRRSSGCGSNQDVLDFMKHGCAGCKGNGACHNRGKEEKHHELA